jgi:hypothetical protein
MSARAKSGNKKADSLRKGKTASFAVQKVSRGQMTKALYGTGSIEPRADNSKSFFAHRSRTQTPQNPVGVYKLIADKRTFGITIYIWKSLLVSFAANYSPWSKQR